MCLAYPPFHLLIPSLTCLVPAVLLLERGKADERPLRRHLVQGFWFGFATNGLVLYWMIVALWHFTAQAALGYAATIVVLGLWHAALFGAIGWIHRRAGLSWIVAFPVLWTAVEWLIGHQGDVRFPWLGLGTSLTGFPWLIQIADVTGARGLTYLLALANVAIALAWLNKGRPRWWMPLAGVAGGVVLATGYGLLRIRTLPLRSVGKVAAIQPNVAFDDKWERSRSDSIFRDLIDQSTEALIATHPALLVWPEAAVPGHLRYRPVWDMQVASLASRSGVPVLAGTLDAIRLSENGQEYDVYNAAVLYDSAGRRDQQPPYYKRYLVPITERVPFVNPQMFEALKFWGSFAIGSPGPILRVSIGQFGVFICYESAFEHLSRDYRRRGADFLVNITNDAWFGRTSAPYQHAAHLVMRAVETRTGIVRAANSGISEFVDPLGRQYDRTPLYVRTSIARDLVTSDVIPLYVRLGDWVGWLSLAATAALLVRAYRSKA